MIISHISLPRTCASKGNCLVNWTDRQEAKEWLGMSSLGSQPMDYCCHELTGTDLQKYHVQTKAVHASGRSKCLPSSIKQTILEEIRAVTHV